MAGLMNVGLSQRDGSMQGLKQAAAQEKTVEQYNDQMEAAQKQQTMSAVGTGAGIGMMAGMQAGSIGGPAGAAIGAGVGLLAGSLLS